MTRSTIGMIGIGMMGHGIGANLLKAGHGLRFTDHPGNQPVDDLLAAGAKACASPAGLAKDCAIIILCVTGTPQVKAVLRGESGLLENMQPGTVIIDCSTAIPASTIKLAETVKQAGGHMLDAPMTRTPKEAAQGRLNLIVGGEREIFEANRPVLECFAENIVYAGPSGAGHTLKLIHNFVSLGFSALLGEAVAASARAGIEPEILHRVLAKGGGAGVVLDRLSPYYLTGDTSGMQFTLANAGKDLGYYCEMAAGLDSANEIARSVRQTYETQIESGNAASFVPELIALLGGAPPEKPRG